MAFLVLFLCLQSLVLCGCNAKSDPTASFHYQTNYFEQYIDHFNYYDQKTFQQKYLLDDSHWKQGEGPIFFYAGNEAPVEYYWKSAAFIHVLAVEMNALVIFGEHRYYGSSMPFGSHSLTPPYLGYLTIEQALADYANLITSIKEQNRAEKCKVIAFGGSYGGILAAYMRFKYPNIIYGSLAASAPIYMQDINFSPRNFFFKHVSQDYKNSNRFCYFLTKRIFKVMDIIASDGINGLRTLSEYLNLCQEMIDVDSYKHMLGWMRNSLSMMAMYDYPYAIRLPASPVNAACDILVNSVNPIAGLAKAVGLYYNSSNLQCFDIFSEYKPCADPTGCGTSASGIAWDYQACTEVWLPDGSDGMSDMFPNLPWTENMRVEYCLRKYGVFPRLHWPSIQFWGEKINASSNIIFSNGDLDPWMGGGVLKSVSDSVVAILIKGGAHHLDLRYPNPADPPSVVEARKRERDIIKKWVSEP